MQLIREFFSIWDLLYRLFFSPFVFSAIHTNTHPHTQKKTHNQIQISPTPAILLLHRSASNSCSTLSNSTILSHIQQQTQQILAQSAAANNASATPKHGKATESSGTADGNSDQHISGNCTQTDSDNGRKLIENGSLDGATPPPAKKMKCDPKDMVDVCVGTSVGTITEPDCLGPCEPGTSVTLEGIVWHETEGGVLVVNVTWRGKTYVGTLLDCTRHDWAPPR